MRGSQEKFAIFGDFGLRNDKCMADLIAEAAKGSFDSGACESARALAGAFPFTLTASASPPLILFF